MLRVYHERESLSAAQAADFFDSLIDADQSVVFPPTAYSELLHTSIRRRYQQELQVNRAAITARYGTRITSWSELYKRDVSVLLEHAAILEQMRLWLANNNVVLAAPWELGPITSGRPYDEELVRLIGRYGLDTNDALILMEASRLGISAIVTMDRDMHRALPDFDVYTWG
jgi:predicted nucleic acid-binding protein